MANADRISEVYKGEIWNEAIQQRARNRIHWLVDQARGRVLDVGCSQGIASLIGARRGLDVIGIDVEFDRLLYAESDRAAEDAAVAERVHFAAASGDRLPFADHAFDSVLLGEILEHLDKPGALLAEIVRVTKPDGVIAITVPFGLSPHHDHRDTFYPSSVLGLVGSYVTTQTLDIVDRYLRLVAAPGPADLAHTAQVLMQAQPTADREFLETEHAGYELRTIVRDQQREAARRSRQVARRSREVAELKRQVGTTRSALERVETRLKASRRRQAELVYERDRWRWQLLSLKSRRFMRGAMAINQGRKSPRRLLRLPVELLRIVFGPPAPRPARPERGTTPRTDEERAAAEQRNDLELRMKLLAPTPPRTLKDLRVAAVLDTFSEACFAPECELITFRPDNWEAVLSQQPPHLLFVESAWQGGGGAWQYHVGTYSYAESVGLPHLSALVTWCRERGIPTVFWNKEDPVHFNKFKQAAQLFDVVLTTDADCVERYRSLPHLQARVVSALPFAAQPVLHNPLSLIEAREPLPVFAGTYYKNRHEERKIQLEMLLDAARSSGLIIFDRTFGTTSDSVGFPERFHSHIRGGLPYSEMIDAYKRYRLFLNANSVFASPTMFSRRVFELLACGTPVVSTPSVGIDRMFDDIVATVASPEAARAAIDTLLGDDARWQELSDAGIRRVHGEHTYAHRLAAVAQAAGYELPAYADERIAALVLGDQDDDLARLVDGLHGQGHALDDLLVGTSGGEVPEHVTAIKQGQDSERAIRYRELAGSSDALWTLIATPGHHYGMDVLGNLAVARRWANADVIGVAEDRAHRYTDALRAGVMLVRRELVARHGWDDRDMRTNLARLRALGARTYAASSSGFRPGDSG